MSTNQYDALAERVSKLERDLETLIDHLANNNDRLFDVLHHLVDKDGRDATRDAFKKCEDGTCTDRPPGCKHHDHGHNGHDDHGGEHGHG